MPPTARRRPWSTVTDGCQPVDAETSGVPPPLSHDKAIAASFLPSTRQRKKNCVCKWGNVCDDLQATLLRYCVERQENHVALGVLRITIDAPNCQRLLQSVRTHLLFDKNESFSTTEIHVARHHFPVALLARNGKKEQRVDGVTLPMIPGNNAKVKNFYLPLPKEEAFKFGIHEEVDRFTKDRSHINFPCYVQAPLAPLATVRDMIQSLMPSCRAGRAILRCVDDHSLSPSRATSTSIVASSPFANVTNNDDNLYWISTPKQLPPPLPEPTAPSRKLSSDLVTHCVGIINKELEDFASSSYQNRGFCATVYSFDARSKSWKSPHCTITVYRDDNKSQCDHCRSASLRGCGSLRNI